MKKRTTETCRTCAMIDIDCDGWIQDKNGEFGKVDVCRYLISGRIIPNIDKHWCCQHSDLGFAGEVIITEDRTRQQSEQ